MLDWGRTLTLDLMDTTRIERGNHSSVPTDVIAALGLRAGDAIVWNIVEGEVRVTKAEPSDLAFDEALVPAPLGYTSENGVEQLAKLPSEELMRLLKSEIEAGRASGPSERSLDDILEAHRARQSAICEFRGKLDWQGDLDAMRTRMCDAM